MKIFSLKMLTRIFVRRISSLQSSAAKLEKLSARQESRYLLRSGR